MTKRNWAELFFNTLGFDVSNGDCLPRFHDGEVGVYITWLAHHITNIYILYLYNVNPGLINPVYGCLIGGVPFMYHLKWLFGGYPLIVINHGFLPNPGLPLLLSTTPRREDSRRLNGYGLIGVWQFFFLRKSLFPQQLGGWPDDPSRTIP